MNDFNELPIECQVNVFRFCATTAGEVAVLYGVCRAWRAILDEHRATIFGNLEGRADPTRRSHTTVFICGSGKWGILGRPQESPSTVFSELEFFRNSSVSTLSCGGFFSTAVLRDGSLYIWGDNSYSQHGGCGREVRHRPSRIRLFRGDAVSVDRRAPEKITRIWTGFAYVFAETEAGDIWSWGTAQFGTLVHSPPAEDAIRPAPIPPIAFGFGKVTRISCGDTMAVAIVVPCGTPGGGDSGESAVWSWGNEQDGRLGNGQGSSDDKRAPSEISEFRGKGIVDVRCGGAHTLTLAKSGEVYSFGSGGLSAITLDPVITGTSARLGQGLHNPLFRKNAHGYSYLPIPARIEGIPGPATQITCGQWHSFVVLGSQVFVFGANSCGQLGLGDKVARFTPTLNAALSSLSIRHLIGGRLHSACLTTTGELLTFGKGSDHQLGHAPPPSEPGHIVDPPDVMVPTVVESLRPFFVEMVAVGK